MPRIAGIALSIGLCVLASKASAQGALTELYGEGVHRYFAGDVIGADAVLTRVIEGGSNDARAYFFRGLARERIGGEAEPDFLTGAKLEAEGRGAVDVGQALSRIQGHTRVVIEKARRDARVVARQQGLLQQRARIDASEVKPATGERAPTTLPPAAPVPPGAVEADPFASDGMRSDTTTVDPQQPSAPELDAATDPFGDDPLPPVTPEPTTPATPAADPFNATPPAADADPFGAEVLGDDPFK